MSDSKKLALIISLLTIIIAFQILIFAVVVAKGADDPPLTFPAPGAILLHPTPGLDYLYDQQGRSASIYQPLPGLSWYSQQDKYGRITQQGYVWEPMPKMEPLEAPKSFNRNNPTK